MKINDLKTIFRLMMCCLSLNSTFLFAQKQYKVDLENRIQTKNTVWGWDNKNLYQSNDSCKTWYRVLELPDSLPDWEHRIFTALNDSLISIYDFDKMERLEFNSQTKQTRPYKLTNVFDDFLRFKIHKVTISAGRNECAGRDARFIEYEWQGAKMHFKSQSIKHNFWGTKLKSKQYHRRFEYSLIDSLMPQLNREPERMLTWSDLNIKESDKKQYLEQIKQLYLHNQVCYKSGYPLYLPNLWENNADTTFLKSLAYRNDFDNNLLQAVFCRRQSTSSTVDWVKMVLQNEQGDTIEILSDDNYKAPRYIMWVVKYKNWEYRTANSHIFKFMSSLSPKSFWRQWTPGNWTYYMEIANYLYPERVKYR